MRRPMAKVPMTNGLELPAHRNTVAVEDIIGAVDVEALRGEATNNQCLFVNRLLAARVSPLWLNAQDALPCFDSLQCHAGYGNDHFRQAAERVCPIRNKRFLLSISFTSAFLHHAFTEQHPAALFDRFLSQLLNNRIPDVTYWSCVTLLRVFYERSQLIKGEPLRHQR